MGEKSPLLEQLEEIVAHYEALQQRLQDPEVLARVPEYIELARRHAELAPVVTTYRNWQKAQQERVEVQRMLEQETDPEMKAYLREELNRLQTATEGYWRQLLQHLLPRDPNDERNVVLEIRAGTGGEEAALFAADLLRMYQKYCERKGWRFQILDAHRTDLGGFREVVVLIEGQGAFSRLKFERGVHRVQRVPVTEASGRIHTSAVSVAVLPEMEEVEVDLREEDLRVDVFSASGPGGQHVNKAMTAVRITHLPTGIVVTCQDERSLAQNRRKALRVLRSRVHAHYQERQEAERAELRRAQVGSGDRSEKIRTYNFPQNRVTDHRIGLTLYRLEEILDGDLDELIDALLEHEQTQKLQALAPS